MSDPAHPGTGDLRPGQALSQYGQRMAQIDHPRQRLAEKIGALGRIGHRQNPQKSNAGA
jgi:hypothetical protein